VKEESGPIARLCPGCGVAVAPGYRKCPRCHAELAMPVRPRRSPTEGGGTAMAGDGSRTLLVAGCAALLFFGVMLYLLVRDTDSGATGAAFDAALEDASDEAVVDDSDDTPPDLEPPPPDRRPTGPDVTAPAVGSTAISDLSRDLRAQRMWATVSGAGNVVVITSSLCDDAAFVAIIDAHAGALSDGKFSLVRCKAQHGEVIFERGL
jgi:hypothetical protein